MSDAVTSPASNPFSSGPIAGVPVSAGPISAKPVPVENLVNEWLSVEAAAIRLGISSRSIARRIQSGQLESRVDDNGRRTVLVTVPAPAAASQPPAAPAASSNAIESSQARELAQQALSVVIRTHEETALTARAEILAARRSAYRGWAAAAILLVGASVTVGIVTHNLTAAAAIVHQAEDRADHANQLVSSLTSERDQLRQQVVDAKVHGAEADGKLAAFTIKAPTTAPSGMQRVASALFGD